MKNTKVHHLTAVQGMAEYKGAAKAPLTNRLISGIKQLSTEEQEILMTIVDAFLLSKQRNMAE